MPVVPSIALRTSCFILSTVPVVFLIKNLSSFLSYIAIPALSYPLYSKDLVRSINIFEALSFPIYPTIPHIFLTIFS